MSFADINNHFLDNFYFFENGLNDDYWLTLGALECVIWIVEEAYTCDG